MPSEHEHMLIFLLVDFSNVLEDNPLPFAQSSVIPILLLILQEQRLA